MTSTKKGIFALARLQNQMINKHIKPLREAIGNEMEKIENDVPKGTTNYENNIAIRQMTFTYTLFADILSNFTKEEADQIIAQFSKVNTNKLCN